MGAEVRSLVPLVHRGIVSAAFFVATFAATVGSAFAAPPPSDSAPPSSRVDVDPPTTTAPPAKRRVVVAGPQDDVIATGVQKELAALGFETIRVGSLDSCARSAVLTATTANDALATACSDGDQVGVWVVDTVGTLRLRDVVVAREEGERAKETTAVRAAEIMRATIALREAEDEASAPPPVVVDRRSAASKGQWDDYDHGTAVAIKPRPPSKGRAPLFTIGMGVSSLLGIDAAVVAFSAQAELRLLRHMTLAMRLEYPIESSTISNAEGTRVSPGLVGAGVDFPLFDPSSFIIPRLGGGFGAAWFHAVRPTGLTSDGRLLGEGGDTVASPAFYASAGISMHIVGALRVAADGIFGSTLSRMVARNEGNAVAYWGQPFGALALRMELMFP